MKSLNNLIYVAYLSHCADRGNFLVMCLRRVGDNFKTYAMTWRRFCDGFVTQKRIACLIKLSQTIRDKFVMHARTLRCHANVWRRFRESNKKLLCLSVPNFV